MTFSLSTLTRLFMRPALLCLTINGTHAGIVEMPVIEEVPTLYGKSVFENYNIPSTINRSLDPTEGPRLWVAEIHIQGLENFPDLGIRREEITAFIEKRRYEIMRENEVREHGFTEKEVGEVMTLLNELDVQTNYEHVTTPELQRFIWLVRSQKERRGLSLSQIEGLAKDVETYYHRHGLKLASAFIPRQSMRHGVLIIEVMNGKLGAVELEGQTMYDSELITGLFDDILTQPVTFDRIEERMYLINDYPGLNVTGLFNPGYQVGDSRLALRVTHEQAVEGTLRFDNHGSDLTGKYRGFAEFNWNNPAGIADRLNLAILQSTLPDNSTYGLLGYHVPLFDPRVQLALFASTNQFILAQNNAGSAGQLGITGKTRQSGFTLEYAYRRSRENSLWLSLIYDTTETILNSDEYGNLGLDDEINNLRLSTRFDMLDSQAKRLHLGSLTLTSGEFVKGAGERDNSYSKLNADYTLMTFLPIPWTESSSRLLIKSELQATNVSLPAAEQNALASPTKVRAYPVNQFSADSSFYLGLEWVFNTPELFKLGWLKNREIHQKMQPLIFINAASGIQVSTADADDVKGSLVDAGFGIQYGFGKNTSGNLQLAFPIADDFSLDSITVPDDSVRVVFDFQYRL